MRHYESAVGKKYNRLTVLSEFRKDNQVWVHCLCDCGNTKDILRRVVTSGRTKSCGCYAKEVSRKRVYKHGLSESRLQRIYSSMMHRCYRLKDDSYSYYGGRGIVVCEEWKNDRATFFKWAMGNGYSDKLTIDRIDSNGNYEPNNCRWVTYKEQQRNKNNNRYLKYDGRIQAASAWAEEYNISNETLYQRLGRGWSIEKALTTPIKTQYIHNKKAI